MLDKITPLILTSNEEINIARVLDKLYWASEIVVLDSCSTDRTREICTSYKNVRFIERVFDTHSCQWNYGLSETDISSDWVLAMDADYVMTDDLINEIRNMSHQDDTVAYQIRFKYCIDGIPLSGSLYPPVVALFRKACANYAQDGHTQKVHLNGKVNELKSFMLHDDRKPLSRWLLSQDRYAKLECEYLLSHALSELKWRDRLRRMIIITPWLVPIYYLTVNLGFRDGGRGIYYAIQRSIAESVLSLRLLESLMTFREK